MGNIFPKYIDIHKTFSDEANKKIAIMRMIRINIQNSELQMIEGRKLIER